MADSTIKINSKDIETLYNIMIKYQDFFIDLAKIGGTEHVHDFNTVAKIINDMLEQVDSH